MYRSVTSASCVIGHASGLGSIQVGDLRSGVEVYPRGVVALGSCGGGRSGQMMDDVGTDFEDVTRLHDPGLDLGAKALEVGHETLS